MSKQLYYETARDGLVPVEFVRWVDHLKVEVRVTDDCLCYVKGEIVETFPI